MSKFEIDLNVQYSEWTNKEAVEIAQESDTDGKTGLNTVDELLAFFQRAEEKKVDIKGIFGLEMSSKSRRASVSNTLYDEAATYFNSANKGKIIDDSQNKGYEILHTLEQDINQAFEASKAYGIINTRPDIFEDRNLVAFDFEDTHDKCKEVLENLNNLRDEIEKAYAEAYGTDVPSDIYKPDYEAVMEEYAQTYLGTDYESFVSNNDLYFTKSITYAESRDSNYENAVLYGKAKNYINALRRYARNELNNMRFDSGERLLDETIKYSDAVSEIMDFEYKDINGNSIQNLPSAVMQRAFLETIEEDMKTTGIETLNSNKNGDGKFLTPDRKVVINKNRKTFELSGIKLN